MNRRSYAEAARTLARGMGRVDGWPGCRELVGHLNSESARPPGQCRGTSPYRHGSPSSGRRRRPLPRDLLALEAHCRKAWEVRDLVAGQSAPASRNGPRNRCATDLIDLALLWTDLKRRIEPENRARRSETLAVLAEVDSLCGPSAAVARSADPWESRRSAELDAERAPPGNVPPWADFPSCGRPDPRRGGIRAERWTCGRKTFGRTSIAACASTARNNTPTRWHHSAWPLHWRSAFAEVYHNRALAHAAEGNAALPCATTTERLTCPDSGSGRSQPRRPALPAGALWQGPR